MTAYYEIRVAGMLPSEVLLDFEWLSAAPAPVETVLHGPLPDQAALGAFLARLEEFGADVIEIRRLRENKRPLPLLPAQHYELDPGRFEPRQQAVQGGLIRKLAAHHGLGRLVRGELLEAVQRSGRDDTRDPDLVVDGHRAEPEFHMDVPDSTMDPSGPAAPTPGRRVSSPEFTRRGWPLWPAGLMDLLRAGHAGAGPTGAIHRSGG
jgi:hypothetical protein